MTSDAPRRSSVMGASRTLIAMLVAVGLLLAGAGTSVAWDKQVSTLDIDGATLQVTLEVGAKELDGDPLKVTGSFVATRDDPTAAVLNGTGPVTCLDIRGNTAGGTVRVETSTNPALIGLELYATVVDGGPGGVDRITVVPLVGPALGCAPRPELALPTFVSGGLVIEDGA